MKKRIAALLLGIVLAAVSVAGCGASETSEQTALGNGASGSESEGQIAASQQDGTENASKTIRVGWNYEPETMNTANASSDTVL